MARTKTTANPPPPKVDYKAQYPWASDELLAECTTFVEPSGVQALKNPNPLKDVEALVVLVVAVLV